MDRRVKLDPFNYDAWDVASTVVQLVSSLVGLLVLLIGNMAGLLGLAALAGGARGSLVRDFLNWLPKGGPRPPSAMAGILGVILASALMTASCGTTISKQFLVDSRQAVSEVAFDYLDGCRMVTIAPAFVVDWSDGVTYGGGVFAGCEGKGSLVEFRCMGILNEETGKVQVSCEPLTLWEDVGVEP